LESNLLAAHVTAVHTLARVEVHAVHVPSVTAAQLMHPPNESASASVEDVPENPTSQVQVRELTPSPREHVACASPLQPPLSNAHPSVSVQVGVLDSDAGQAALSVAASHVTVAAPDWVNPVSQENVAVLA
jgi:hypothetical protein